MRKFIRKVCGRYEITATAKWVPLTNTQIAQEYEWEYVSHIKPYFGDFWPTVEDFKQALKLSRPISLTQEQDRKIQNRSRCKSIEDLKELTSKYSFPRDVDSIVEGLKSSDPIPYPIILKDDRGTLWVMSGNTRLDVAFLLGITPKILVVDVPEGLII